MNQIPEETTAVAAADYLIFAFDEGTSEEIRHAKMRFNERVADSYRSLSRTALMRGFHRPTADEFRAEFITQCRNYLRRKGLV